MELNVSQLTEAIRTTIGTPFHHGGRVNQVGLDCGGMVVVSLRLLGYTVADKKFYNRGDGLVDMLTQLEANNFYQRETPTRESICPGDLILIRTSEIYHHLVYVTEFETVIHAWVTSGVNKVVESVMLPEWWENINSVWRFGDLPVIGNTWE